MLKGCASGKDAALGLEATGLVTRTTQVDSIGDSASVPPTRITKTELGARFSCE